MTLIFQFAVFALIATSSILLISVPAVFASPDGWSSNKNVYFSVKGFGCNRTNNVVWAHNKLKVAPATQPRALSIVQGLVIQDLVQKYRNERNIGVCR